MVAVTPDVDDNRVTKADQVKIARAVNYLVKARILLFEVSAHTDHFMARGATRSAGFELGTVRDKIAKWTEVVI